MDIYRGDDGCFDNRCDERNMSDRTDVVDNRAYVVNDRGEWSYFMYERGDMLDNWGYWGDMFDHWSYCSDMFDYWSDMCDHWSDMCDHWGYWMDGVNIRSGFLDDRVETSHWVCSVLHLADVAVGLDQRVGALYHVAMPRFPLSLIVPG